MPQINLLAPTLGKKTKKAKAEKISKFESKQIQKMIFPVSVITGVAILGLWLLIGLQVSAKNKKLQVIEEKEKILAIDPQELTKLKEIKNSLKERIVFIEELLFTNFLWSEKFEEIAKVIPFGIWLTNISLEKRRLTNISLEKRTFKFLGLTDASKDQFLVLVIKGNAVAPTIQDAIGLIGKFNDLLKQNKSFSKDFFDIELKSESVSKGTIGKTDIMSFEFICIFK